MKLRTFTGLDKETECACGCHQKILARPDVQVVVDMDSPKWKRDRYLPGHAGNGYGSAPYAHREKKEEPPKQTPTPAPPAPAGPAPQGPSPASPQPQVDPAPVNVRSFTRSPPRSTCPLAGRPGRSSRSSLAAGSDHRKVQPSLRILVLMFPSAHLVRGG